MFIIAEGNLIFVIGGINKVIEMLNSGAKRADVDIDMGDGIKPLKAVGYWAGEVMRIDLKVNKL